MRMPLPAVTLLFVAIFGSGCTYQIENWKDADMLRYYSVMGIAQTDPAHPNDRVLAMEYEFSGQRSILLVPLRANGAPKSPFEFPNSSDECEFWGKISPSQRTAVLQASKLEPDNAALKQHLSFVDPIRAAKNDMQFPSGCNGKTLVAIAYRIDANGQPAPVHTTGQPAESEAPPTQWYIAIVPRMLAPDLAEHNRRQAMAIAATPFAFAVDLSVAICLSPIWVPLVIFALATHCCH